MSAALVFVFGLCLAAATPRPRNARAGRLGRLLVLHNPHWRN